MSLTCCPTCPLLPTCPVPPLSPFEPDVPSVPRTPWSPVVKNSYQQLEKHNGKAVAMKNVTVNMGNLKINTDKFTVFMFLTANFTYPLLHVVLVNQLFHLCH